MARETWRSYRAESRENFGGKHEEGFRPCDNQIAVGCLARIADAVEKMAQPYADMVLRIQRLEEHLKNRNNAVEYLRRSNRALRGHMKRVQRERGKEG